MDEADPTRCAEQGDGNLIASLRAAVEAELVEALVLGDDMQAHRDAEIRVLGHDMLSDELELDVRTEPATLGPRRSPQPEPEPTTFRDLAPPPSLLAVLNRARYRVEGIDAVSSEGAGLSELAELAYRSGRLDRPGMVRIVLEMGSP